MFSKDNILATWWEKVPHGTYTQMKTRTGLRVPAVWSESSLSAWRNVVSLAIKNAPSENSDQTANAQADLVRRWAHMSEGAFSDVGVINVWVCVKPYNEQGNVLHFLSFCWSEIPKMILANLGMYFMFLTILANTCAAEECTCYSR